MTEGVVAAGPGASRRQRFGADLRELAGSSFLQNVIGTLGSRAVLVGLGLATAVIVTRALGPEGRGLYATAVALSAIGVQVGNMGLHASNTWAVARERSLLGALIANSLLASSLVGGAVVIVALALFAIWPSLAPVDFDLLLLALVSIPLGLVYLLLQNLLLGTDRIRAFNVLELALRTASAVALMGLLLVGVITAFNAFAVTFVLTGLAGLVALGLLTRGLQAPVRPSRTLIVENARYGLKAYVAAMVAFLLFRIDVLFIQFILGAEQTGYYAVAVSLADNIYILPVVVGTLLFPRLSTTMDESQRWRLARTAAIVSGVVMSVVAVIAVALADPVIRFLFGEAFLPAAKAFVWLMPGIVLISVNTPLMNYFAALGMPPVVIVGPLVGLVANLALNLFLIPAVGIVGASMASTISYSLMFLSSVVYLQRSGTRDGS